MQIPHLYNHWSFQLYILICLYTFHLWFQGINGTTLEGNMLQCFFVTCYQQTNQININTELYFVGKSVVLPTALWIKRKRASQNVVIHFTCQCFDKQVITMFNYWQTRTIQSAINHQCSIFLHFKWFANHRVLKHIR